MCHRTDAYRYLRRHVGVIAVVVAVVAGGLAATTTPARAVGPGANGKIAFTSDRDGNPEIYTMNPDGTGLTRLTTDPATDSDASWSADGTKITFASNRVDGNYDIYSMNADGADPTRLTTHPASDNHPHWSPDGTRIAFVRTLDGNDEIYVMNADGTGQTRLTTNPESDAEPTWSPDSAKIIFQSGRTGNYDIYTMNPDGTGLIALTTDPNGDGQAAWSPDSARIAFANGRDGNIEVYVMNSDGSGQTNLTHHAAFDQLPAWSPDSTKIAFVSDRDGNSEIYTMNANGSGVARLTTDPANDSEPDWAPAGPAPMYNVATATKASGANQSITAAAVVGASAGDTVTVSVGAGTFAGPTGCSDSNGNSYTVVVDKNTGNGRLFVCSATLTHTVSAGDVITATYPKFSGLSVISVNAITAANSDGTIDQTSTDSGNNPNPSSGQVITLHSAELVFGVVAHNSVPICTPGPGFTAVGTVSGGTGSGTRTLTPEYMRASTAGTYAATASLSSGQQWRAAVITYR